MRQRLGQVIGAENGARVQQVVEQIGGVAVALWQQGPAAAWPQISQQAGDLKEQALALVQQQVLGVAARAVPVFLATLAVPGGAFVQAAKGIYAAVMLFVEKGQQIVQVGAALLNSVGLLAAGQLGPAAQAVETTLVRILPVALGFLAKWLNLDGISGAIQTGLKKVQAPVEKAVTKVLDVVTDKARVLWGKLKAGAGTVVDKGKAVATNASNKVAGWLGLRKPFTNQEGERHTLFLEQRGQGLRPMVASTPQPLEQYLQTALTTATPQQVGLINQAEQLRQQLLNYTVGVDGPAVARQVEQLLAGISGLLAQIGGQALATLPLPTSAGYAPGSPKRAEVKHVSSRTAHVGGSIKSTGPNGWDIVREAGLTAGGHWVRMHLVSDKLGGPPQEDNLLPAPGAINTGPVLDFETRAKNLLATPQRIPRGMSALPLSHAAKQPTVLWITAQTTGFYAPGTAYVLAPGSTGSYVAKSYKADDFATGVALRAGLVIYNPTQAGSSWERDDTVLLRADVALPLPNWQRAALPGIHFMSRTALAKETGCSPEFAELVKRTIKYPATGANIPYRSETDFESRMQIHAGVPYFQVNLTNVLNTLGATGNPAKITLSTTV